MGGGALPNFLLFSDNDMSFRLFTLSPDDTGTYMITVKVSPSIYNVLLSNLVTTFMVTISCSATKLTPQDASLEKNFRLGTTVPSTVTFKDFIVYPVCNSP